MARPKKVTTLTAHEIATLRIIVDGGHSFEMIRSGGGGNGNTVAALVRKKLAVRSGKRTALIRATDAGRELIHRAEGASNG